MDTPGAEDNEQNYESYCKRGQSSGKWSIRNAGVGVVGVVGDGGGIAGKMDSKSVRVIQ